MTTCSFYDRPALVTRLFSLNRAPNVRTCRVWPSPYVAPDSAPGSLISRADPYALWLRCCTQRARSPPTVTVPTVILLVSSTNVLAPSTYRHGNGDRERHAKAQARRSRTASTSDLTPTLEAVTAVHYRKRFLNPANFSPGTGQARAQNGALSEPSGQHLLPHLT